MYAELSSQFVNFGTKSAAIMLKHMETLLCSSHTLWWTVSIIMLS